MRKAPPICGFKPIVRVGPYITVEMFGNFLPHPPKVMKNTL
jgi:hypothetical protein